MTTTPIRALSFSGVTYHAILDPLAVDWLHEQFPDLPEPVRTTRGKGSTFTYTTDDATASDLLSLIAERFAWWAYSDEPDIRREGRAIVRDLERNHA